MPSTLAAACYCCVLPVCVLASLLLARSAWELQHSAAVGQNGIRVHELGHNLGLHHSGQMDTAGTALNEYGDCELSLIHI